jgi:predicted DNA-binding ribbon-helix-helix protein
MNFEKQRIKKDRELRVKRSFCIKAKNFDILKKEAEKRKISMAAVINNLLEELGGK